MSASVEEILDGVSVCICAGSGGVGKTTTSAAIAAGMAARGRRVAVLTIDPAKRLADSLGLGELGNEERRVDPALLEREGGGSGGELWAAMLDAKATFDDIVARYAPDEESRRRILDNRIYREISGSLAGSQEYMAMERLYELHESGRYDLLVLDTPPSRNALDFLDAPRRIVAFVEGRAIRLFLRPTGFGMRVAGRGFSVVASLIQRLTGLDLIRDLSEFFAATSGMIGGFRERAERVDRLLGDERTSFLIVTSAAAEATEEAAYLRGRMDELGLRLGGVVVNRGHPASGHTEREAAAELAGLLDDRELSARVVDSFRDRQRLASHEAGNVEGLVERIGSAPVVRVPELADEVHDVDSLLALGRWLFAEGEPA
jgi:anion-transporting  ArsA/GET3 family ATPase